MKKLIFTTITTLVYFFVSAQSPVENSQFRGFTPANKPDKSLPKTVYGKTTVSDWYSPYDFATVDAISSNLTSYVGFIQHDSIAKLGYSDGTQGHVGFMSIGRVLDPKDSIIDFTTNPGIRLSKFNGYTLDSIRFTYLYVRNVDSIAIPSLGNVPVVDTLILSYWNNTQIAVGTVPSGKYGLPSNGWNYSLRVPSNTVATETKLLTRNDSTFAITSSSGTFEGSFRTKVKSYAAPSGITIGAPGNSSANKGLVGCAFTFIPGVPSVYGTYPNTDTAWMLFQRNPTTFPAGGHRTNYFGYYYASNQGTTKWSNPTYYNTSLMGDWRAAYSVYNGWNGYVAALAYNQHESFVDIDFHLTSLTVDVKELKNENFTVSNISPNPAKVNEGAFIALNLKSASKVRIEIFNLMGQSVSLIADRMFDEGKGGYDMYLNGIKPGIYFVNVTVNGETQSRKLTIVE